MVLNLSTAFTDTGVKHDVWLTGLMQQMKIRIIGHGIKENVRVDRLDNYILPSFLLVYYYEGAVSIFHAGQTTKLCAGSFYLHNPFEVYSGLRTSDEPLKFLFVNFDIAPLSVRGLFKRNAFSSGDGLFAQEWYRRVGASFKEFCQPDPLGSPYQEVLLQQGLRGIVAYILYDCLRRGEQIHLATDNEDAILIDQAFAYTEQHLAEPIRIGQLVRVIGTSRSSLYRAFLNGMQSSPFREITRFKVERGLEMLKNDSSVKETAKALGYSSPYHFSNTFKTIMGKRPTEYIKGLMT